MREALSTRLPNEHILGLKKKELLELYEKEFSSSPPESDTDTEPLESPKNIQEVVPESQEPEPETEPEPVAALDPIPEPQEKQQEFHVEKSIEIVKNSNGTETEIERHQLIPVHEPEVKPEDNISPMIDSPLIDDPREELIQELKSLKNSERKKRAKKAGATEDDMDAVDDADDSTQALIDLIVSLELPDNPTKPNDPESDEELDEDKTNYEEISHDGVDYLEDEETGNIYNLEFVHVGKWNENNDDIIWVNDDYRRIHEENCDQSQNRNNSLEQLLLIFF